MPSPTVFKNKCCYRRSHRTCPAKSRRKTEPSCASRKNFFTIWFFFANHLFFRLFASSKAFDVLKIFQTIDLILRLCYDYFIISENVPAATVPTSPEKLRSKWKTKTNERHRSANHLKPPPGCRKGKNNERHRSANHLKPPPGCRKGKNNERHRGANR